MKKGHILIVDDEKKIVRLLAANMRSIGYEVSSAQDGVQALESLEKRNYDLILLDVMMPGMDGFEVLKKIRELSDVPVIMLTAKDQPSDKVRGLNEGADDYLTKPFSIEELFARVNAIFRRVSKTDWVTQVNRVFCHGLVEISLAKRKINVCNQEVKLTDTEFKLFTLLAKNAGKVMTHEQLLGKIWGTEYRNDVEYLRVTIARIRQKIKKAAGDVSIIQTYLGVGYLIDE